MTRSPWIKWFPSDWRADPSLRICSLAARGLWIELLGFMHEAEPYGHLVVGGRPPTEDEIAALVGVPVKLVRPLLAELTRHRVPSFTDEGVMFSRRMVRDKARADADRANGGRGGNPRLKGGEKPDPKPPDNPRGNRPLNEGVNPPHKAHMPEARGQRPEAAAAAAQSPAARDPAPPPEPAPPDQPPPDRSAEADQRHALGLRVLEAARIDPGRWTGTWGLITAWQAAGYDPELDILPTIRAVAARPGYEPPASLKYFTGAIETAWRDRCLDIPKALSRPQAGPAIGSPEWKLFRAIDRWGANGADPARRPKPEDFGLAPSAGPEAA